MSEKYQLLHLVCVYILLCFDRRHVCLEIKLNPPVQKQPKSMRAWIYTLIVLVPISLVSARAHFVERSSFKLFSSCRPSLDLWEDINIALHIRFFLFCVVVFNFPPFHLYLSNIVEGEMDIVNYPSQWQYKYSSLVHSKREKSNCDAAYFK